jgi:hypothetical protein
MSVLDYDDSGGVIFSGTTDEAGLVKVYAGEILVGETRVGAGGRWNFIAGNLLPVGKYYISSELVQDEVVAARIDVPFVRMAPSTEKETAGLPAVVYDLESWQISRPLLGGGIQHTVIFASEQKVEETKTAIEVIE